jgi:NADPH:quinone reductase-like Zn-dependent oxidoreductase
VKHQVFEDEDDDEHEEEVSIAEFRLNPEIKEKTAMRAYVVERPGEAFTQFDLPRPAPSAGQVLVRVHASGVNPLDTKIRAGKAAHAEQPLPAVLGLDMAGVVEEVGPGVTNFRPCDEVYGMVGGGVALLCLLCPW